jgi:hypothetical protein
MHHDTLTADITANDLLQRGPARAQAWLDHVQAGRIAAPADFNWLGLAQVAAQQATYGSDAISDDEALAWARIAVDVYDRLANRAKPNSNNRNEFERSAMFVRAALINRFGAQPGHPLLDPHVIEQWFFDRLSLSPDQAIQMTNESYDRFLQLRAIKNRLAVIELLMSEGHWRDNAALQQWVEIRDRLP